MILSEELRNAHLQTLTEIEIDGRVLPALKLDPNEDAGGKP